MSLFQRVNFLLAMRADSAALPECCLLAPSKPSPPPADKTSAAIAVRPSDTKQMSLMGAEAETQEIQHVHEVQRSLQVPFHGAVSIKNPEKIATGLSDAFKTPRCV